MTANKQFPFMNKGTVTSSIDDLSSGVYGFHREVYDIKVEGFAYGELVVLNTGNGVANGGEPNMQIITNMDGETATRIKWNGVWGNWRRTDNFGYNTLNSLASGVAELLPIASSSNNGLQTKLNYVNAAPYAFSTSNTGKDQLYRFFRNNEAYMSVAEFYISGMYTEPVYAKIIAHDSYIEVVCDKKDYFNVYKDNAYIYVRLNYSKLGDWSRSVCKMHSPTTYTIVFDNVTESVSIDNLTLVY